MKLGLLDRSECALVAARALIIEAYDRATLRCRKEGSPLSMGCGAIELVEELFREHEKITEAYPDNVTGGDSFRTVFKHARVRITHFVSTHDDHVLNTESMAPAFIRGAAFICRRGKLSVDLVVPLLLWDEKIGERVMSAIFVQIKLKEKKGSYYICAEDFDFFPRSSPNTDPFAETEPKRPYITLVMELGVQNDPPEYAQLLSKSKPRLPVIKGSHSELDTGKPLTGQTKFAEKSTPQTKHPRYTIVATGCSDTVYAVIEREDRTKWELLLGQDDLFGDHPHLRTIPSVRRMKPFWALGSECYSWYKSSFLNWNAPEPDADQEDQGSLYVPTYEEGIDETGEGGGHRLDWEVGDQ